MIGAAPSDGNLYGVYDYGNFPGYQTVGAKVSTSTALVGGESTLIFLFAGQSLAGNHGVSLYTPTHSTKVQQLNVYDGVLYRCADPVLGCSGTDGSHIGRLGDKLIDAGKCARVIFIPISIGGTGTGDWISSGSHHHRLRVGYAYARKLGWPVSALLWSNGETDGITGVSQATYQANIISVQGALAGMGYAGPMFVAKETIVGNVASLTIQAAQDASVDHSANRWAGPNLDSLTGGTNRQGDGTHLTDVGNDSAAALWVTALGQVF